MRMRYSESLRGVASSRGLSITSPAGFASDCRGQHISGGCGKRLGMSEAFLQTALLALLIDLILGWPERFYRAVGHPVGLFAAIIVRCEGRWNDPARSPAQRHRGGELTLLILVILAGSVAWVVQLLLLRCGGRGGVRSAER